MDAFEQFVRGGMARAGLDVDETELAIMRYIDELFGPDLHALMTRIDRHERPLALAA